MCINTEWEGMKQRQPDFSVVLTDRPKGNRHKLKHRIFQLNTKKTTLLYCDGGQTLAQAVQRGWGIPIHGDIQNCTGSWATLSLILIEKGG